MKIFCLFLFFVSSFKALAQQSYFTEDNKKEGLRFYREELFKSYPEFKEKQRSISHEEMKELISAAKKIVEDNFSQAFEENPAVKVAFEKDMNELSRLRSCLSYGNDCRAQIIAHSLYYYQRFRPDIPHCKGYVTTNPVDKDYNHNCELELKYRKNSLQGVQGSQYGMSAPGTYKKQLIALKNMTTSHLLKQVFKKEVSHAGLDRNEPGEFYAGIDPEYLDPSRIAKKCIDEKVVLHSEFVPMNFDEGKSTVGQDQVEPIKVKILNFIKSHPEMIITDVLVVSSSSKTPFYRNVAGKKVIDPKSNERNLSLATERAAFAEKALAELKEKSVNLETKAVLGGPDFQPIHLNERFVTRMTPGYVEKIEALFKKYQKQYEVDALKSSYQELLDEKQFVNLYQAKFKPFHGFRLSIKGFIKEEMKCLDTSGSEDKKKARSSKQ